MYEYACTGKETHTDIHAYAYTIPFILGKSLQIM